MAGELPAAAAAPRQATQTLGGQLGAAPPPGGLAAPDRTGTTRTGAPAHIAHLAGRREVRASRRGGPTHHTPPSPSPPSGLVFPPPAPSVGRVRQVERAAARPPHLPAAPAALVPASPAPERQVFPTQSTTTPAQVPPPQTPAAGMQACAAAAAARALGGREAFALRSLAGPPLLAPRGMRPGRRHGVLAGLRARSRRGRGRGQGREEAAGRRGRGPLPPAYRTSGWTRWTRPTAWRSC